MTEWKHGNNREAIKRDENRVRKVWGGRWGDLRWPALLPRPRWPDDRNLQLWEPPRRTGVGRRWLPYHAHQHSSFLQYSTSWGTTKAKTNSKRHRSKDDATPATSHQHPMQRLHMKIKLHIVFVIIFYIVLACSSNHYHPGLLKNHKGKIMNLIAIDWFFFLFSFYSDMLSILVKKKKSN